MATRIRDRAIRRMGELLKQIEPAHGARTDLGPVTTRGSIATDAGISPRQSKQALRVANDCAQAGLVMHDQSQHTKADRRAAVQPHSVTLNQAGRDLAREKR
jgi:hypothetical protein